MPNGCHSYLAVEIHTCQGLLPWTTSNNQLSDQACILVGIASHQQIALASRVAGSGMQASCVQLPWTQIHYLMVLPMQAPPAPPSGGSATKSFNAW